MSQRGTGHAGSPVVSFEEVSKVYGNVRAVDGLSQPAPRRNGSLPWPADPEEMVRLSRNKRYLIFSIALPVMLYLVLGKQATSTAETA